MKVGFKSVLKTKIKLISKEFTLNLDLLPSLTALKTSRHIDDTIQATLELSMPPLRGKK